LVLLTPARFHIDRNEYFDGGPDAVVEIHSPGDEAYDKLDFYAKLNVREVWIIDRDTRLPEMLELVGDEYRARQRDPEGWSRSAVAGVEMRPAANEKLEIRMAGRMDTQARLP
jgi:Uma2 family endonuclease